MTWRALILTTALAGRCAAADLIHKEGKAVDVIKQNAAQPAVIGAVLVVHDRLSTGQASRAVLRIRPSWNARVDEETLVEITDRGIAALDADTLSIPRGRAFIYSREQKGEWRLQTPGAAVIGRGTQIVVQVSPNGATFVQVLEGEAELSNNAGRVDLARGEAGEAAPGVAPRKTAVIEVRHLLQWALYYPAVVEPADFGLSAAERQRVQESLAAYAEGDLPAALEKLPAYQPQTDAERLYRAAVLLAVGQVGAARDLLAAIRADHPVRRALERMLASVLATPADSISNASTSGEALAESYYQQSLRALPLARTAATQAASLAPSSGFAWTRLAELEFSFGRTAAAWQALENGLRLTPRNAQAHALAGYLYSAENRMADARAAFERALRLDGALGPAWLGLGLTKIKQGQIAAGRQDLQTAATVEPTRALFYSYHAKALSAEGTGDLAARELALAQRLDPGDPTPWLYSAVEKLLSGHANGAVDDLQQSLRLNDRRQVYRSTFLLDQDRAMRSANLAQVYREVGMADLAVREATAAVENEYANASAHLFLANSFDALRDPTRLELRHETAWFNELLLANLLAPVGGGSLSQFVSQQEYSKLLESDRVGASSVGEWRSDGQRLFQASVFGTRGRASFGLDFEYFERSATRTLAETRRREAYGHLKYQIGADDVVYSLVKWMGQDNRDALPEENAVVTGRRYRERQEPGLLLLGWNRRWAPGVNTLLLGGRLAAREDIAAESEQHLFLERDPAFLEPNFLRRTAGGGVEFADPVLRSAPTPPVYVNPDGSRGVSADFTRAIAPFLGAGAVRDVGVDVLRPGTRRSFTIHSAEVQHLWQAERHTLMAGVRAQSGDFEAQSRLDVVNPQLVPYFSSPAARDTIDVGFQRLGAYAYELFSLTRRLTLIGGVSWDRLRTPANFRLAPLSPEQSRTHRASPKAGFTYSPHPSLRFRGVYAESLGGVSFDESVRLEPVQLAGFVQAFRTVINETVVGPVEAPVYTLKGVSVDGAWRTRTWARVAFSRIGEDVSRTRGAFDVLRAEIFAGGTAAFPSRTVEQLAYREDECAVTINQLLGDEFAVGGAFRQTRGTLRQRFPEIPEEVSGIASQRAEEKLDRLTFTAIWNSPRGWFARGDATGFWQRARSRRAGESPAARASIDFWRVDVRAGFRFHRNRREVSAGVLNLSDHANTLRPLTGPREMPDERTFVVRYRMNL